MATAKTTSLQITALDKTTADKVHERMVRALEEFAVEYGITIVRNGGTLQHDQLSCVLKFKIALAGVDVSAERAKADWPKYCALFDLRPEWLGMKVIHSGAPLTIVGLQPNRQKFPVLVAPKSGNRFLITAEEVIRKLGATTGAAA